MEEQQQLSDEDLKFLMRTGGEIRNLLIAALSKEYSHDPEKMKSMFMNVLTNSVVNILNDVSKNEEGFQIVLTSMIKTFEKFVTKEGLTHVSYNTVTEELVRPN